MGRWRLLLLGIVFIPLLGHVQAREGMSLEQIAQTRAVARAAVSPGGGEIAYVLLVINPHHMRLIGVPRIDMTRTQLYEQMLMHLDRCERCLSENFELTLSVKRVVQYDDLYALSKENKLRMAH